MDGRAEPTLPQTGRMDKSQEEEAEEVNVLFAVVSANWRAVGSKHVGGLWGWIYLAAVSRVSLLVIFHSICLFEW